MSAAPTGYRIVTAADREAHPLVPPAAKWMDSYGRWWPTKLDGDSWCSHHDYAIPLGLWPEGDPAPEPATVAVPCDLAEEIHERLSDLASELDMWVSSDVGTPGEREMRDSLIDACTRLRACPGYGSGAR
jgi:hypothetical protein